VRASRDQVALKSRKFAGLPLESGFFWEKYAGGWGPPDSGASHPRPTPGSVQHACNTRAE